MDRGPIRSQRPTDARVVNTRQDQPSPRQADDTAEAAFESVRVESAPVSSSRPTQRVTAPSPVSQSSSKTKRSGEKSSRKWLPITLAIAFLVVLAVVAIFVVSQPKTNGPSGIDTDAYQAVFLADDRVYFGKLTILNDDQYRLTDVYYIEPVDETASEEVTSDDQPTTRLLELINAVYGPQDEMIITKDQVAHFQNLREDSTVSRLISGARQ